MRFALKELKGLTIVDDASFRRLPIYVDLKRILAADKYRFRILPKALHGRWDHALMLNLTFWGAGSGGDVLVDERIPADVVAHAAWHHLAARHVGTKSAEALFLGESIASAFDLYLVGHMLALAPSSNFLTTQVTRMAEVSQAAGVSSKRFASILETVARQPETSFESLRQLLFDTTLALYKSRSHDQALAVLATAQAHPFGGLLHHYEVSNWVLFARTYGGSGGDTKARAVDRTLRKRDSLAWLVDH